MKELLKAYQKRLTNLTPKNRSIYLGRLSKRFDLDLKSLFSFSGKDHGDLLSNLLRGKTLQVVEVVDPRLGSSNELSLKIKNIHRQGAFVKTERGNDDLHIAWPYVEGKLVSGMPVRAPLVFFPVDLNIESGNWTIALKKDVPINLNKSLLLSFSHYSEQKLEEELLEFDLRDLDPDHRSLLSGLFRMINESAFQIRFNSEIFEGNTKTFRDYTKKEFEKNYKEGELHVLDYGVLGLYPQAGSFIVPDYDKLIQDNNFADLEEFFSSKVSIDEDENWQVGSHYRRVFLNRVKEDKVLNPLPIDASQENALKAIKKGHSIVVQGPPGSGKSQLISNLISDNITRGKNVLLVCQKRVALEVVYERLKKLELHQFVARVTDFKNERGRIYEKIESQIESINEYQQINNGIDSILLERDFLQTSKKIDQLEEELSEFRQALFESLDAGISPKEAYLQSDVETKTIDTSGLFRFFKLNELDKLEKDFNGYYSGYRKFDAEDYPWRSRKSFKDFGIKDEKNMLDVLDEIPRFQFEVNEEIKDFLFMGLSYNEHKELADRKKELQQFARLIEEPEILKLFNKYQNKPVDGLWLENRKQIILDFYVAPGPETSIPGRELDNAFYEISRDGRRLKNPLFKMMSFVASPIGKATKKYLQANKLQPNAQGISSLERKVSNRMNLVHNLSLLRKSDFYTEDLPEMLDRAEFLNWIEKQEKALKSLQIIQSFRSLESFFDFEKTPPEELKEKLEGLILLSEKIIEKVHVWEAYLSRTHIFHILANNELASKLKKALKKDFEELCHYDQLLSGMKKEQRDLFNTICSEVNSSEKEAWQVLKNSIRWDWISHLEEKYPTLREVSRPAFPQKIDSMKEAVAKKLELTKSLVLLRARERTYSDLEYNRLNNLITYRDLKHQVTKKRKIWPLRKVIHEFYGELFNLIPCWMASPESVSAMFPLEQVFDLVIFDEASQCFSEKGIPALYRGKQIAIFGDKNQLSPFDLYQARYEDPGMEEDPDLEAESLLDLGSNYLMEVPLTEHYRSESLDLIGFSNQHFYKSSLNCVPHYQLDRKSKPIEYRQVKNPVWENNQNLPEAREVVETTLRLISEGEKDIGIITFNFHQQQLIADLLEAEMASSELELPKELFVKNLENVQGDERDIIIFSPAYGPDVRGKLILNFGMLNQIHGERRLNVAITRARKKIIVFSSLDPLGISTEHLTNPGPRLFLDYLVYAKELSKNRSSKVWQKAGIKSGSWYLSGRLAQDLERLGLKTSKSIPFTDLLIEAPKESSIACLTDDEQFFEAGSCKHFFAYLPTELERKNWAYKYTFSRNYWRNGEGEVEEIVHYLNWKKN